MRTASVFGSAALFDAMQANICPPIFSAGAPYIVLASVPGIRRPIARTVRNVMRPYLEPRDDGTGARRSQAHVGRLPNSCDNAVHGGHQILDLILDLIQDPIQDPIQDLILDRIQDRSRRLAVAAAGSPYARGGECVLAPRVLHDRSSRSDAGH